MLDRSRDPEYSHDYAGDFSGVVTSPTTPKRAAIRPRHAPATFISRGFAFPVAISKEFGDNEKACRREVRSDFRAARRYERRAA